MFDLLSLLAQAKTSGNPMQLLTNQISGNNPMMQLTQSLIGGKNPNQLRETAYNLAKERGIDLNKFAEGFGISIPKI